MIIEDYKSVVNTTSELDEKLFSVNIEDMGLLFDILRNKLYSNPIYAVCREITCNARDTHRAVGKQDIPIEIYIPSYNDPYFKVRDFGEGISPDRMENIFIKYSASTKRDSNLQVGCMGLGCKTPFAISDNFSIITNYNGIQYNYACFIDDTKLGKLILLSESPTAECNGTTIIVPIKHSDFYLFNKYVELSTRYWDVKPNIFGGTINYQSINKIIEGDKWSINECSDYYSAIKVILDGIEYSLDMNALKNYSKSELINSLHGDLLLYFNTGDPISISASRENLYLDDKTKRTITERLNNVSSTIQEIISDRLNACQNLYEANFIYSNEISKIFRYTDYIKNNTWKDIKLHKGSMYVNNCCVYNFQLINNKVKRFNDRYVYFKDNSSIFINDLGFEPSSRQMRKVFDEFKDLKRAYVVVPDEVNTEEKINELYHFDMMDAKYLSDYMSDSKIPASATTRLVLYKFDKQFHCCKKSDYDNDNNKKVLCLFSNSSLKDKQIIINDKSFSDIGFLNKINDVSIYGVDRNLYEQRKNSFRNIQLIDDYIKENILPDKEQILESVFAINNRYEINSNLMSLCKMILKDNSISENSSLIKLYKLSGKILSLSDRYNYSIMSLYEHVYSENIYYKDDWIKNHPEYNFKDLEETCKKKYPLLFCLDNYRTYSFNEEVLKHLADYINSIDQKE